MIGKPSEYLEIKVCAAKFSIDQLVATLDAARVSHKEMSTVGDSLTTRGFGTSESPQGGGPEEGSQSESKDAVEEYRSSA